MKKHTRVYLKHFDIPPHEDSFIPCEYCWQQGQETRSTDIHHLIPRGMGGSKTKDNIENLMALCREHHELCEKSPDANETAKGIHEQYLNTYGRT